MPRRGEKGFTLIELLIVVAILGILAAIVVPNVIRFLGRGEEEAQNTEYNNVVAAVSAMMVEHELKTIPNPVEGSANRTQDMTAFPDATSDNVNLGKVNDTTGVAYTFPGDTKGYILYGDDATADSAATPSINHITFSSSKYWYSIDADATVHQYDSDGAEIIH